MLSCILFLPYLECAAVNSAQDVVTACRLSEWQKLREKDSCHLSLMCLLFSCDELCLKFEYVLFTSQNVDWKLLCFKMPFKISRGCLHLLQRDGGNSFLPSSLFFSWIVYLICLLFSSSLSIISAPLFLYVALSALLGLILENEWELCHIQSAVHLTLCALLNASHCFPMNTRIRVKPFHFVWVAWGSFESSVLRHDHLVLHKLVEFTHVCKGCMIL